MEKIYIRLYYLRIIHYFFFALAILSLTSGIMFFEIAPIGSITLFFLTFVYSSVSLYIANRFLEMYENVMKYIVIIKKEAPPYFILAFWTLTLLMIFVYFFPFFIEFVFSFLYVNYYIFFVLVIGFLFSRFEVVGKLFSVWNVFILRRSQKLASEYADFTEISDYEVGSDPKIDEILDGLWSNRVNLMPWVRKLEIALFEKRIEEIDRALDIFGRPSLVELVEVIDKKPTTDKLKKEREEYLKNIKKIKRAKF